MEENNKVYVFERKEIFLVVVFFILTAITCFTLGVKLGKGISFEKAGYTEEDKKIVDMKSSDEDEADKIINASTDNTDQTKEESLMDASKEKLNEEFQKFGDESVAATTPTSDITAPITDKKSDEPVSVVSEENSNSKQYVGKFTIQLGSYNSIDEAKQFTSGFTARGYNPIINEVVIPDKGTWYRVSLGLFNNMEQAKAYIKKEASLFQGQDYIISEIK